MSLLELSEFPQDISPHYATSFAMNLKKFEDDH